MAPLQRQVTSTDTYNYLLFLPDELRPDGGDRNETQQPLLPTILFLHGAGERGSDLDNVKKHGVAKIVNNSRIFPLLSFLPNVRAGNIGM